MKPLHPAPLARTSPAASPPLTVALVDQGYVVGLRERPVVVVPGGVGRVERGLQRHQLRIGDRFLDGFGELGLEGLEVRSGGGHLVFGSERERARERERERESREKTTTKVGSSKKLTKK